jgi:hypothetical protein
LLAALTAMIMLPLLRGFHPPGVALVMCCVCRKRCPLDLTRESLNVGRGGRADFPAVEPGYLALQTQVAT